MFIVCTSAVLEPGSRQCLGITQAHCISDIDVTVLKYFECITEFDIEIEYYSVTYFKYITKFDTL